MKLQKYSGISQHKNRESQDNIPDIVTKDHKEQIFSYRFIKKIKLQCFSKKKKRKRGNYQNAKIWKLGMQQQNGENRDGRNNNIQRKRLDKNVATERS